MLALQHLELPSTQLLLSAEQKKVLLEVHRFHKFKSRAATKIIISMLEGDEFRDQLGAFLKKMLRSGVPSVYNDVCNFIRKNDIDRPGRMIIVKDPSEFRIHPLTISILSIVDSFITNLRANGTFDGDDGPKETPLPLLWALFLKSHLLEKSGNLKGALDVIDECLVHTPSALDMYIKKGICVYSMTTLCMKYSFNITTLLFVVHRAYFA